MMIPGGGLEKTVQKQKRYSDKFKSRMIQRMTGRRRMSACALSKEVGVAQPTLSLWLREAGSLRAVKDDEKKRTPPARRAEDWPAHEKLAAVMESESIAEADLGVWLRRRGLKEEHLRQWRESALSGVAARPPRASSESRKRVKDLERQLKRKDKALAETAALLVLQGKMEALWAEEDDATRQTSDEPSSRTSRKRTRRGRG